MPVDLCKDDPYGTFKLKGIDKLLQSISKSLPKGFLPFKLALALRKLVLIKGVDIVDVVSLEGFKMRLYPQDNVGDRLALFMPWYFEHQEFQLIRSLFKSGDTFLDIGSNSGYYTLLASKLAGKEGKVLAFEPNPLAYNRMQFNLGINNHLPNISTFNFGLADREGQFQLLVNPRNLGEGSIHKHPNNEHFDSRVIQCRVLLDVLKEESIETIDFMKIDIEQAEPLVLNPFFEKAPKSLWPKHIIVESIDGIPFEELGYQLVTKTKNNTVFSLSSSL